MKGILISGSILIIVLTSALLATRQGKPADNAPAAIMAAVETATPEPTEKPTNTATPFRSPTPDFLFLAQGTRAALDVELAQARNTAEMAAVTSTAIVAESQATETRIAALQSTSQAAVEAKRTQIAQSTQMRSLIVLATVNTDRTATAQAPITRRNEIAADWEPVKQATLEIGLVAIILLLVYFISINGVARYNKTLEERRLNREAQPTATLPAQSVQVRIDKRDSKGLGRIEWTNAPVDLITLRDVATMIISGVRYTQAQMCGAGRPLVKDGSFNAFGDWMVRIGLAIQHEDGRYTILDRDVFEQVLI